MPHNSFTKDLRLREEKRKKDDQTNTKFLSLLTFFCEKNILRFLEIRSTGKSFSEALILATPSRTPRISGLKSQILKPTFLS